MMYGQTIVPALLTCIACLGLTVHGQSNLPRNVNSFQPRHAAEEVESDRMRDGLTGPVRRVRTEIVKLSNQEGKLVEGKRSLLEIVAYDIKGHKIENQYFPVAGTNLTGKEVYKYDERGNISEMTLLAADGTLAAREIYRYEFDFAGNWNKMVTSVAVVDGGTLSFEPAEVTYRSIMYYLDGNMAKMVQPVSAGAQSQAAALKSGPENRSSSGVMAASSTPSRRKIVAALPSAVPADAFVSPTRGEVKNVIVESQVPAVTMEEPPPSATASPILKAVSGGVLNGSAINLPSPIYPESAKRMRITGTVVVMVVVDETGKVISAQVDSGPPTLRDAAIGAALRARFSPTKLSGQPVKVSGVINYRFSLGQ